MTRCDHCRSVLLDHLYGLLEPADAAAVDEHLVGCPACTAARDREARAQGLIARAAKVDFPHVRFIPPVEQPLVNGAVAEPAELASPGPTPGGRPQPAARESRRAGLGRVAGWAVAASVLVGVSAAALVVNGRVERADTARGDVAVAHTRAVDARDAVSSAHQQLSGKHRQVAFGFDQARRKHDDLLSEWVAAERKALTTPSSQRLAVQVTKPAAVQPGAPNTFELSVQQLGSVSIADQLLVEVRTHTGRIVYSAWFDHARLSGKGELRLPPEMWLKVAPDDELFLAFATVDARRGEVTDVQEPIRLYGPVFTTLLVTDRPGYRPGDPVYFRSLTLDRVTFRPPTREQHLRYELRKAPGGSPVAAVAGSTDLVRVADGRVETVIGPDGKPVRGVGCGVLLLPPDLPDGEYSLILTELPPPGSLPPVIAFPLTRTIRVRSGPAERYQKQVGFSGAGYAPGEFVRGWAELKSQDRPVEGVAVQVTVVTASEAEIPHNQIAFIGADGNPLQGLPRTGPDGKVRFGFLLPLALPPGDVRVKVTFLAPDGAEETAVRAPVVDQNLTVEFLPEGGTLVEGVPCRVYVRATDLNGRPADVRGAITDGQRVVATVATQWDPDQPGVNRGLGSFTFTPQPNRTYRLVPNDPTGLFAAGGGPAGLGARTRAEFVLPPASAGGVVMSVPEPVVGPGHPVRVTLYATGPQPRTLMVGAYTRGRPVGTTKVTVQPNKPEVVELFAGNDLRGGVTRVTVFEERTTGGPKPQRKFVPIAERLVFRRPAESLNLAVTANGGLPGIAPGSPVDLTVRATDEKGAPAPAVLFVAVTNAGGTLGPKDRLLTTQFLVAGEVQNPDDLEYADFLLTDHPRAAESLDLVLATQGWRRFVEQYPPGVRPVAPLPGEFRHPTADPDRQQLLLASGGGSVRLEAADVREQAVFEDYQPRYEAAARGLDGAQAAKAAADADHSGDARVRELLISYDARRREVAELADRAETATGSVAEVDHVRRPVIVGLAVLAVGVLGVVAARRTGIARSAPLILVAAALVGLAVFLDVGFSGPTPVGDHTKLGDLPQEPITGGVENPPLGPDGGPGATPVGPKDPSRDKVIPPPSSSDPPWPKGNRPEAVKVPTPGGPQDDGVGQVTRSAKGAGPEAPAGPEMQKKIPDGLLIRDPFASRPVKGPAAATADVARQEDGLRRAEQKAEEFIRGRAKPAADRMQELDRVQAIDPGKTVQAVPAVAPDRLAIDRVRAAVTRPTPLVAREYAAPRPLTPDAAGPDSPDTVLWQPVIVLPGDGTTTLRFHTGNSPAGYEVIVAGHTPEGRIGATRALLPVAPGTRR
jgi:hypothetical protein